MRVLVTGATGMVGSAVVRELVSRGHRVRVLARPKSNLANLTGLEVEIARGDILDRPSVDDAAAGCEGVVHTAGLVGFRPGLREKLLAVNVRGVENVFGAALAAGAKRAVLTSSTSALGGSYRPEVADETKPSNAEQLGIDYFVSKLRGERAALRIGEKGLPVVILRPGFVLGPGDLGRTSGSTVLGYMLGKFPGFVDGGVSFCDVRDVAAAHADALERGRAGEAYLIGGHNLRMGEACRRVSAVAGMPVPRRIPYLVALFSALGGEVGNLVGRRRWHLTVDFVRSSGLFTFVSSEKAERELGYRVRGFEEMARDTIAWWLTQGKLEPMTPELERILQEAAPATPRAAAPRTDPPPAVTPPELIAPPPRPHAPETQPSAR
jgi:dihydroflavonol-4-reductase